MEGFGSLPQEPVCNRFETGKAVLYWAANAAVFLVAREVYGSTNTRNRFLRGILSFGAAVGLLTVVQYFTSGGRIFWVFPIEERGCPARFSTRTNARLSSSSCFHWPCTSRWWTGGTRSCT